MAEILSQEEIATLMASANEVERAVRDARPDPSHVSRSYDFRRPDRVTKEQIRALHFLHDRFARNVSTSLSAYLRSVTSVSVLSVEPFTYAEFLASLPDPTVYYALSFDKVDLVGAMELHPSVAFAIVDRMLGGTGTGLPIDRALTEIEQNVVDAAIDLIVDNLAEAWQPTIDLGLTITGRESRPQMLQVATLNEQMITVACDIKVAGVGGTLHFCMPTGVIDIVGSKFSSNWQRSTREPTPEERRRLRERLDGVLFDVAGQVDTTMPVRELIALRVDDIVTFGRPIASPVDVIVDRSVKYEAHLVRAGHRAGLRVEEPGAAAPLESA